MSHKWCDKLGSAARKRKSLHRAVFLTEVLLLVSLAVLGYCAILQPEAFDNPSNLIVYGCLVLGLGTLIFQAVLLAHLVWNRMATARLQARWLRLVFVLAQSHRARAIQAGTTHLPGHPVKA